MDKERRDNLVRLVLRSIPFAIVPGPELFNLFQDLTETRTELDKKVEEAVSAIRNASTVVAELEQTLAERTSKLETLRAEVERVSKIAAVEEAKAAPILRELDTLMRKGRTQERVVSLVINIVAGILVFLAGAYFGPRLFPSGLTNGTVVSPASGSSK
jgi:septal ring factor EnvC (AmiA/AmiB activator)